MSKKRQTAIGVAVGAAIVLMLLLVGTLSGCATFEQRTAQGLYVAQKTVNPAYKEIYKLNKAGIIPDEVEEDAAQINDEGKKIYDETLELLIEWIRHKDVANEKLRGDLEDKIDLLEAIVLRMTELAIKYGVEVN